MSAFDTKPNGQTPDQVPLTKIQAKRLSGLTGIDAGELAGLSVVQLTDKFRWQIDPELFFFRRICGKVVKRDPATGVDYPVPFATVYAQDTDCSILGLFPVDLPWTWFFPFFCETETIAVTTTDACGNFCVWVPRFEIDWILRFRLERRCYLELFNKPTVERVIKYLQGNPIGPDPAPDTLKPGTALYQKVEQVLGSEITRKLAVAGTNKDFGSLNIEQAGLLARQAFSAPLSPALPKLVRATAGRLGKEEHLSAVQNTLANHLSLDATALGGLDFGRYYGPFLRCYDVLVPEWVPIFEVPDISFRVTQDVNGTGEQEVIYGGGLFDISWNTNTASDVTLLASQIAVSSRTCNVPPVNCTDVPEIQYVGLMPLINPALPTAPYVNSVTGFATRPNPPHLDGTIGGTATPPSTAPYTRTLQLYGCNDIDKAVYYRLRFTYTAPGDTTASALTAFTGLTWPLHREDPVTHLLDTQWPVSDADGWYPVLHAADGWSPIFLLLEWDTTRFADGLYTVQLEVADSGKTVLATSQTVGLRIDNSIPVVHYTGIWSLSPDMSSPHVLPTDDCVVIDRGVNPVNIYIQVSHSVTANHLRHVEVSPGGCAGGATLTSPASTVQHWYEDANDNSFSATSSYVIPASQPQGVYTFNVYATSRAFNPAGGDTGDLLDWNYNPVYNWTNPSFAIAIVNA